MKVFELPRPYVQVQNIPRDITVKSSFPWATSFTKDELCLLLIFSRKSPEAILVDSP